MDFFLLKENCHFYFMSIIVQVVLRKHREKNPLIRFIYFLQNANLSVFTVSHWTPCIIKRTVFCTRVPSLFINYFWNFSSIFKIRCLHFTKYKKFSTKINLKNARIVERIIGHYFLFFYISTIHIVYVNVSLSRS